MTEPAQPAGPNTRGGHLPVMLHQVRDVLAPRPGETAVDLTIGLGGHAEMLSAALGPEGTLVGFDRDQGNLQQASQRLEAVARGAKFIPIHASFTEAPLHLARLKLSADVVLADLGFSSNQMSEASRGFSFATDGPLDMRLDQSFGPTAADLLACMSEGELADLIYRLGEDPFARRIARKLAQIRQREPIRMTSRLAAAVVEAYGPRARASRMHPATRTFMALRIAVNDELGALQTLLEQVAPGAEHCTIDLARGGERALPATPWLARGARLAIISFHSLEDRQVKRAFADLVKRGLAQRLTRKPLTADEQEVLANPRARSAKLRAIALLSADIDDSADGRR